MIGILIPSGGVAYLETANIRRQALGRNQFRCRPVRLLEVTFRACRLRMGGGAPARVGTPGVGKTGHVGDTPTLAGPLLETQEHLLRYRRTALDEWSSWDCVVAGMPWRLESPTVHAEHSKCHRLVAIRTFVILR